MSDFQSYLDKALKNLDVNATKKEDDSFQNFLVQNPLCPNPTYYPGFPGLHLLFSSSLPATTAIKAVN